MPPIAANQIEQKPLAQDKVTVDPTLNADEGTFYAKEVSGVIEAFFKNGGGQVIQLTQGGQIKAAPDLSEFELNMINDTGSLIATKKPVAIKTDGSMALADSDDPAVKKVVGFTKAAVADQAGGQVVLFGRRIPGALTGLGFVPGDEVFLNETAGTLIKDIGDLTGDDDDIIKLGIACMGDGLTGGAATDLIMLKEVVTVA